MKAFATAHPGLESILAREVEAIGMAPTVSVGGVEFDADDRFLLDANLQLRTAGRVLVRLAQFRARTFPELERHAAKIPWTDFLGSNVAVHFRVTSKKSRLYHERGIAERLERALVGQRPVEIVSARSDADAEERSVDLVPTVQRFIVRFHRDVCTVSADSSGPPLHRRGYRTDVGKAPLRETLAAALLLGSGWSPTEPLIDPFCGSGTIPIEAGAIATGTAPGLARRFSLESWPSFSESVGRALRDGHRSRIRPLDVVIAGSDRDAGAIAASEANAERAGSAVVWRRAALSAIELPQQAGWIATNPPYGARVGERAGLRDLYAQFGNVLRSRATDWRVAMISADRMLEAQTKLEWVPFAETSNGGIDVRFLGATVRG